MSFFNKPEELILLNAKSVVVGFSGGVDSTLVLSLLRKIRPDIEIHAISIKFADSVDENAKNLAKLYKVNPQIKTFKNNNLVFDISDSSLSGYKLKFYYDNQFKNEFNSVGVSTQFNVIGTGSTVCLLYTSPSQRDS